MARRPLSCLECGAAFLSPSQNQKTCPGACRKTRREREIRRWKDENAARITANAAAYYAEDPERQRTANAVWRAKDPARTRELARATNKRSYIKRAVRCRAYSKLYFATNPGVQAFHSARLRVRTRKAKAIFDTLVETNPAVYATIADARDKGRAMLSALKSMGIEVPA